MYLAAGTTQQRGKTRLNALCKTLHALW